MQYLQSVTSFHPGTVIKMYAADKKLYFVSLVMNNSIGLHLTE